MKAKMSTNFFNLRLFLEGLKRLRVIGTVVGVLSVVISALIPAAIWISTEDSIHRYGNVTDFTPDYIEQNFLCISLYILPFLAPFFLSVLFSFLHKRRESDFFHAIPYTRTCLYVSFVSAALAMVAGIGLLSATVSGILWAVCPYTYFSLWELISLTLVCLLASFMLSGFMMLALSITGTGETTAFVFLVSASIMRIVMGLFSACLDINLYQILPLEKYPFFSLQWFLPMGIFDWAINGRYSRFSPFTSPTNLIYSLVVTLILFLAAWFFFKRRKSEMAGNAAPNRLTQHIFRCLVTLPVALLIPFFMMEIADTSILLILVVATLLVYYLYEIITTKKVRNVLSATPWLLCVLATIVLFTVSVYGVRYAVLNEEIDEEDILSVSLDEDNDLWDPYQQLLMSDLSSEDPQVIRTVAINLQGTQYGELHGFDDLRAFSSTGRISWQTVKITLKSGRVLWRNLAMTPESSAILSTAYENSLALDEAFWDLPDENKVRVNIASFEFYSPVFGGIYYVDLPSGDLTEADVITHLYREYASLSMEEKRRIRDGSLRWSVKETSRESYGLLELYGAYRGQEYTVFIYVDDALPYTKSLLEQAFTKEYSEKTEYETRFPFDDPALTEPETWEDVKTTP